MLYEDLFEEFDKKKVKYLVVGGMAVNLLGGFRATFDLDILIELSESNVQKLVSILKKKGFKIRNPVDVVLLADPNARQEWIQKKNIKAFNFFHEKDVAQVDVIIESPVSYEKGIKTAFWVSWDSNRIPVISLENLIEMKRAAGRPIDQADILDLRKIKKIRDKK